jgi:beta-xylosidase
MVRRARVAAVFTLVIGLLTALPSGPAQAGVTDGLVLWYKLDEGSGTVAADSSGHGRDGTVTGAAGWSGAEGLAFNGTDTYVQAPNNLMAGLSSISVAFDVWVDPAQQTPYFIYGFGNTSGGVGNGYLFTTGNDYRTSIATGNWTTEQTTRPSAPHNLTRGTWKHVAYTQTGTTAVLYEDGVEVGRNTAVTITPGAIGAGTTTANYLGRSVYPGDRYLSGKLRDFRVYDRALAPSEVDELARPANAQAVQADLAALSLGDTGAVTANLILPATGPNGSSVTWATSDSAVVSSTGVVTRPALGQPDAHATLTATIRRGGSSATKTFDITVLAEFDDARVAREAADALVVHNLQDVRGNLTLPVTGTNGTTVAWASANPAVVSTTGEVHRPAHGAGGTTVALTATVTKNAATATRTMTAIVPELPAAEAKTGYMFSYFTGEGTANGEQVYFALSNGNNALSWREINSGNPVLTSTLGERGLRDPFIIRSPEGDKFYQIATDLRIYGNGNWDAAQRTGSKSIMVWESTDLVHWTDQRLVRVSPDTAGNTWAPEAFYDDSLGAYVVFWASKLYATDDPDHTGSTYNRMMYATTRDFRTFSEPKVWVDPGYSVIDSTVLKHGDTYYRFTKDERNNTSSTPCSKFIIEEKSTSLLNLDWSFVAECIGKGSINQGEGPLVFKSNTEDKWYLFIDEFGGRGYVPFESTDPAAGQWTMSTSYSLPSRPRHGTVLPVTAAEYNRLLQAYQPNQLAVAVEPVAVATGVGQPPVLPATAPAAFADGVRRSAAVAWDPVPASAYASVGTFTVSGTLVDNATLRATATVTVGPDPVPVSHLILRYEFDETSGAVARDSSGRGFDGAYNRTPAWGTGVHGGSVKLSGGGSTSTTAPYITIPNGVLAGATSVTVSTWVKWTASTTVNQWIYGLGPDNNRYLFTGPSNGSRVLYSAITTGSWSAESSLPYQAALPGGSWQHVAVTVDGTAKTAAMYLNGTRVASATNVTVKPSDLYDPTKSYSGYIGRSLYSADPYFAVEIDDLRIYDTALSPAEILELAGRTTGIAAVSLPQLKVDAIIDDVTSTVTLPVRPGTDLRALAPQFTLARGATLNPATGTTRDFTAPVTYIVTGADGAVRTWTVRALEMRSPVLPGLFADPNITVFGDTFYIYPTTDGFPGWSGTQFHAFSSKDLVHWQDHGVVLDLGPDVSWADNSAWAPTIAEKNGKYYLYFSGGLATGNTAKHLGVAVADSPTGPFTDALGRPLVAAGTYSGQMIDPAVFTDDDGQSYLYWGNGNAYQVPLNDDMVSFDPAKVRTYHPTGYNEGSFVFKRNGTYYFTWSENDTRSEDYQVAYATGSSPLGPWSDRQGVILRKDPALGIKGTGHHSVVRVPGSDDWYIAYHRFAIPGGDGTHRETTIDRLTFDASGGIAKVVPTLEGPEPVTIVHAGPDASGGEGAAIPLSGTVSGATAPLRWSFAAGPDVDAGATCAFADPAAAATTVTCTDDGTYTVTLHGGRGSDSATVTVANAAPVIAALSGPGPVPAGTPVTLNVTIIDAGANDTRVCTVDWGDGTAPCADAHRYAAPGVYTPVVTVRDDDGGSATRTLRYVVVSPARGPVLVAGGWQGGAEFGFVARHPGLVSCGEPVDLRLHAGDLEFRATGASLLLVIGPIATVVGTGTVNGVAGYSYLLTLVDSGGRGADHFRLRVWNSRTGAVAYANVGDTALDGGDVVIRDRAR